ncbi:hypothetical protein TYRP_014662 [Tyrophagus putrescentiae]|nr:hypothetical protein TYRP_014662 [Tyrophagus putrescentiae]
MALKRKGFDELRSVMLTSVAKEVEAMTSTAKPTITSLMFRAPCDFEAMIESRLDVSVDKDDGLDQLRIGDGQYWVKHNENAIAVSVRLCPLGFSPNLTKAAELEDVPEDGHRFRALDALLSPHASNSRGLM